MIVDLVSARPARRPLTFTTPYARFHPAGKASPIAFLLVAIGAGIEVGAKGAKGAVELAIVAVALLLTLPPSTHLLVRANHRATVSQHLRTDELAPAERELGELDAGAGREPIGSADGDLP